jgi:TonB family protein
MKGKIKVMNAKPEITDQEIRESMDFAKLLVEKEKLEKRLTKQRTRRALLGISAIAIVSFGVYVISYKPFSNEPSQSEVRGLTPASDSTTSVSTTPPSTSEPEKLDPQTPVTQPGSTKPLAGKDSRPDVKTPEPSSEKPLGDVYEEAAPAEGYPALYEYFSKELAYPAQNIPDSIRGEVVVIFVIDVAGKPVNIQIENSLGQAFDEEAIRIVRKMPAWTPATFNGKAVPSKIRLPLSFETEKVKID